MSIQAGLVWQLLAAEATHMTVDTRVLTAAVCLQLLVALKLTATLRTPAGQMYKINMSYIHNLGL